jgi:hypothetical protein
VGAAGADAVMAARRDEVGAAGRRSEAKLFSVIDDHSRYAVIGVVGARASRRALCAAYFAAPAFARTSSRVTRLRLLNRV